ncbi:MAG TPA: prepilin-type N-terminal cleavage/methylation domain-containing protein [Gemmataceae bacterium]|jgi:hypothetical protein|nr:prepilin-type N-terminal cleavage/methylation domain-containing protein [Gemmataceae bacterium]
MKALRKGVTLIEALMAIFVTAIGLLSLLVLFPVGAFRMAQAITDDRAAHEAANAFAQAECLNIHFDPQVVGIAGTVPNGFTTPAGLPDLTKAPNYNGPSYPVYVDPIGFLSYPNTVGFPSTSLPRRSVSFVLNPDPSLPNQGAAARYWFSLLDDLTFQSDTPTPGQVTSPLTRDGAFTAAYMLRRPRFQIASVVDTTVVVYKNRPSISGGENAYGQIAFNPGSTEVTVTWNPAAQEPPPVRKGSWILDATVVNAANNPEPHGHFYRVVSVTDGAAGTMILEFQNPPKQSTMITPTTGYGVLVVMENVVEVFEKGPGWRP